MLHIYPRVGYFTSTGIVTRRILVCMRVVAHQDLLSLYLIRYINDSVASLAPSTSLPRTIIVQESLLRTNEDVHTTTMAPTTGIWRRCDSCRGYWYLLGVYYVGKCPLLKWVSGFKQEVEGRETRLGTSCDRRRLRRLILTGSI